MKRHHFNAWYTAFTALLGFSTVVACGDTTNVTEEAENTSAQTSSTTSPAFAFLCEGSQPTQPFHEGLEKCDNGMVHRTGTDFCEDTHTIREVNPEGTCNAEDSRSNCTSNADCTNGPGGWCVGQYTTIPREFSDTLCSCQYQQLPDCETDADCSGNQFCKCEGDGGYCIERGAGCLTDDDCTGDMLCLRSSLYFIPNPCNYQSPSYSTAFHCQTLEDECASSQDCAPSDTCWFDSEVGHHVCTPPYQDLSSGCAGRPFLVNDEFRLASLEMRRDWCSQLNALSSFTERDREIAAEGWTEAGLMEHASIAAFARFAMQLMSLGAPPELIEATTQAMQDETHHAKDCFALASMFAGRPIGPGVLPIENALDDGNNLLSIVALTIHEGCIGETVAALEAVEALQYTTDPTIRSVLERIARDERQHAALAWRFLQWVLTTYPHLRFQIRTSFQSTIDAEMRAVERAQQNVRGHFTADTRHLGFVDHIRSLSIRLSVLRNIIQPCALNLFQSTPRPKTILHGTHL